MDDKLQRSQSHFLKANSLQKEIGRQQKFADQTESKFSNFCAKTPVTERHASAFSDHTEPAHTPSGHPPWLPIDINSG